MIPAAIEAAGYPVLRSDERRFIPARPPPGHWSTAAPEATLSASACTYQGGIMRIRFASYLAMGIVSAFLIVASYAFAAGTFMWLAFAGGIVLFLLGCVEVAISRLKPAVAAPAALVALVGVAMAIVAVAVTERSVGDAGFGLAIATGALSAIGLGTHELAVEDDIHRLDMLVPGSPVA
jgi:hypothetical protein